MKRTFKMKYKEFFITFKVLPLMQIKPSFLEDGSPALKPKVDRRNLVKKQMSTYLQENRD